MSVVSLTEAKLHLRVTQSSEDALITLCIAAAEDYIRNLLNARIPGEDLPTPNPPAAIKSAALLLIGGMFETREDKQIGVIISDNPSVMNLLHPYRKNIGV